MEPKEVKIGMKVMVKKEGLTNRFDQQEARYDSKGYTHGTVIAITDENQKVTLDGYWGDIGHDLRAWIKDLEPDAEVSSS
jgi:hypothetical protein